jgi:hypothetical protein
MLELMLCQILRVANYCLVILRINILKNSMSINNIWQTIRLHYDFQSTGAHFIYFSAICCQSDERLGELYQRIMPNIICYVGIWVIPIKNKLAQKVKVFHLHLKALLF